MRFCRRRTPRFRQRWGADIFVIMYDHVYDRRLRRQAKHEGIRAVQMKEWRTREVKSPPR